MSAARFRRSLALFALGCLFLTAPGASAQQTAAQQMLERRLGRQVSSQEILRGLAESGLSREQVRARLRQRGLDASLADPYFDRLEGRQAGELPAAQDDFVAALVGMGLIAPEALTQTGQRPSSDIATDTLRPRPDSVAPGDSLPVFGKAVFARRTEQFAPVLMGPVPPDYRLGPGDELALVLTGDVELAYTLPVSREGSIVIPDVGQVSVNGLTLGQLEDRLYERLGRVYSGVRRGPDATTHFQVSLGRLRVNQVFVVGEVEYPSAYEIPSIGTALSSLYRAGGPRVNGTFRNVQVRRAGRVVAEVDLYDYLLTGDTGDDVRLEQGDIVFVPLAGTRVRVTGAVERPAVYELLPGEGLEDAVAFAGGGTAEADLERVRVDRILPPGQRTAGRERVLEVVDLLAATGDDQPLPLSDGDRVRVPRIGDEQKDMVSLTGFVYRTGDFELLPGMTVNDLLERAGGLRPEAFRPVAHVRRLDPSDSTYVLHRVSLAEGGPGEPAALFQLADQDSVTVFGRPTLLNADSITVIGEVKEPGRYGFARGMTAQDAVLAAGGFTRSAQGMEMEVSRLRLTVERTDTVSERFRLRMDGTVPWDTGSRLDPSELDDGRAGLPDAGDFELLRGDQVFVRTLPGYVEPAAVHILGEVIFPGPYAFTIREERLSSFVRRAGGLTDDAHAQGVSLVRDSIPVAVEVERALEEPGSEWDPVLRPDDMIRVPLYDGTVAVRGAVAYESRVIYREGEGLDYYLHQAGGTLEEADDDRIHVTYQNGERAITGKFLWIERYPDVRPGSVIEVPFEVEGAGTDWSGVITTSLSILSTTATLILALSRL